MEAVVTATAKYCKVSGPATCVVTVPAGAKVYFDTSDLCHEEIAVKFGEHTVFVPTKYIRAVTTTDLSDVKYISAMIDQIPEDTAVILWEIGRVKTYYFDYEFKNSRYMNMNARLPNTYIRGMFRRMIEGTLKEEGRMLYRCVQKTAVEYLLQKYNRETNSYSNIGTATGLANLRIMLLRNLQEGI